MTAATPASTQTTYDMWLETTRHNLPCRTAVADLARSLAHSAHYFPNETDFRSGLRSGAKAVISALGGAVFSPAEQQAIITHLVRQCNLAEFGSPTPDPVA